ncbi:MAG: hypothetical protein GOVbin1454_34 [Prokaryotic dsDNA virus sp.]|nr:MAG: hypothetical protein GOVbin1454_34 [Prokaryotic dsDNA virus sp.]|tara:strand:- start:1964 stop:2140 length:177 start_codon:yes stop_codon:yes gene_type:complete
MIKVKATSAGTWPSGCHWTEGEVRDLEVDKDETLPSWLVEVKTKKSPAKKAAPVKSEE